MGSHKGLPGDSGHEGFPRFVQDASQRVGSVLNEGGVGCGSGSAKAMGDFLCVLRWLARTVRGDRRAGEVGMSGGACLLAPPWRITDSAYIAVHMATTPRLRGFAGVGDGTEGRRRDGAMGTGREPTGRNRTP